VLPSLVLVTTAYTTEPEAVAGRFSKVTEDVAEPKTVAPLRPPLDTAPSDNAVNVDDPGSAKYHLYAGMHPLQVAVTLKLAREFTGTYWVCGSPVSWSRTLFPTARPARTDTADP
jgi:hypothetical protein